MVLTSGTLPMGPEIWAEMKMGLLHAAMWIARENESLSSVVHPPFLQIPTRFVLQRVGEEGCLMLG